MKGNEAVLNDLLGKLYTVKANDKIPDKGEYPLALVQAAQNQKQINTGLAKLLKLKIGVKVMLSHTEFAQDSICEEYVKNKFSDE